MTAAGWLLLLVALYVGTFGLRGGAILASSALVCVITLIIRYAWQCDTEQVGTSTGTNWLKRDDRDLCSVTYPAFQAEPPRRCDERLTGAPVLDVQLLDVMNLVFRDFVDPWYLQITADGNFKQELRIALMSLIVKLSSSLKSVNWLDFVTRQLVEDLRFHFQLYREALNLRTAEKDLVSAFFEVERQRDGSCQVASRHDICTDEEVEGRFLRAVSDSVLYLLLPSSDFGSLPTRALCTDLVSSCVLLPCLQQLAEPDNVNLNLLWLCAASPLTEDHIKAVVKLSRDTEELRALQSFATDFLTQCGSQDARSEVADVQRQMAGVRALRHLCASKLSRVSRVRSSNPKLVQRSVTLDYCLARPLCIDYIQQYLQRNNSEADINFYLNAQGLQQIMEECSASDKSANQGELLESATTMFNKYLLRGLSNVPLVKLPDHIYDASSKAIQQQPLSSRVFAGAVAHVRTSLDLAFVGFMTSELCEGMLAALQQRDDTSSLDLDLGGAEDVDGSTENSPLLDVLGSEFLSDGAVSPRSASSRPTSPRPSSPRPASPLPSQKPAETGTLAKVEVAITGVNPLPAYVQYEITVQVTMPTNEQRWICDRRYSDFHDFYMCLRERFPNIQYSVYFPPKSLLNTNKVEFQKQRRAALDTFLRVLLQPAAEELFPGVAAYVLEFVQMGQWQKANSAFSRKVEGVVKPMRDSVRIVGNAVTALPRAASGMARNSRLLPAEGELPGEEESSTATHLFRLLDDVFRVERKLHLRRPLIAVLQSVVSLTHGHNIDNFVIEVVERVTSPDQLSKSIRTLKENVWPGGRRAEPTKERDATTIALTRVAAKARLLNSLPDNFVTLIGTPQVQESLAQFFDLFQHRALNRRLLHVLLESVLKAAFPKFNFGEVLQRARGAQPQR